MTQALLLTPAEVDRLFRYPRGRTKRLALAGKLAYVKLPDGQIRIARETIDKLLAAAPQTGAVDAQ